MQEIDPKDVTIPGKKDLRLRAKISGFPAPTILWLRDGNEIKVRKGVLMSQDASGGATLTVEKCTMSDAGIYTAKGVNDVGECETSCTVTVASNGTQIKGTYNFDYAAPEILEEAQAFPQSDVWSLGVLLYVLMSGQLPFKGETPEESKDNILRVQFKFEWLYKECTMEGTRLLMWIFKRKPHARPSLEEVGAHRWTNPADYMLKKRERARFPTNRIQKFSKDYHKSRPCMDMDSQSFMARLLQ